MHRNASDVFPADDAFSYNLPNKVIIGTLVLCDGRHYLRFSVFFGAHILQRCHLPSRRDGPKGSVYATIVPHCSRYATAPCDLYNSVCIRKHSKL